MISVGKSWTTDCFLRLRGWTRAQRVVLPDKARGNLHRDSFLIRARHQRTNLIIPKLFLFAQSWWPTIDCMDTQQKIGRSIMIAWSHQREHNTILVHLEQLHMWKSFMSSHFTSLLWIYITNEDELQPQTKRTSPCWNRVSHLWLLHCNFSCLKIYTFSICSIQVTSLTNRMYSVWSFVSCYFT